MDTSNGFAYELTVLVSFIRIEIITSTELSEAQSTKFIVGDHRVATA